MLGFGGIVLLDWATSIFPRLSFSVSGVTFDRCFLWIRTELVQILNKLQSPLEKRQSEGGKPNTAEKAGDDCATAIGSSSTP
jgi:hypothetical protein